MSYDQICPKCISYMQLRPNPSTGEANMLLRCSCGYTINLIRKDKIYYMLTLQELNPHNYPTNPNIDHNLIILLGRINQLSSAYGKPMIVTSGLRSQAQQQALIAAGKSNAPKSHHLTGEAVDILDEDGSLNKWCKANLFELTNAGLWCEERQGNWQHFQCVKFGSYKEGETRFFFP